MTERNAWEREATDPLLLLNFPPLLKYSFYRILFLRYPSILKFRSTFIYYKFFFMKIFLNIPF